VPRTQWTVQRSDFHVAPDADLDDRSPKTPFIDVLLVLPDFADGTAQPETVAPSFRHMLLPCDRDRVTQRGEHRDAL